MADKFDPYREALIVEADTIWPDEFDDWDVPKRTDFEVRLHKGRAAEGVAPLLGGVDVGGAVKPHVKALAAGYEGETASAREQTADMEERVGAAEGEGERLAEEIGVSSAHRTCPCCTNQSAQV